MIYTLWVRIVNNGRSSVPAQTPPAAKMIDYRCLKMTTVKTADKDGWMLDGCVLAVIYYPFARQARKLFKIFH